MPKNLKISNNLTDLSPAGVIVANFVRGRNKKPIDLLIEYCIDANGNLLSNYENKSILQLLGSDSKDFMNAFMNVRKSEKVLIVDEMVINKYRDGIVLIWSKGTTKLSSVEERFVAVLKSKNLGAIIYDLNFNIIFSNATVQKMTGYTKNELLGKNASLFSKTLARERVFKLRERLENNGNYEFEDLPFVNKDNQTIYLSACSVATRDGKGNRIGSIDIFLDASTTYKNNLKKYSSVLDAVEQSDTALIIKDKDGVITYVNAYFTELFGYSNSEIVGSTSAIYETDLLWKQTADIAKQIKDGKKISKRPVSGYTKDRKEIFGYCSYSPMYDDDGEIIGSALFFQDINELKKIEKESKRMSEVVKQSSIAIVINDEYGVITYANDAMERLSGYSQKELIGRTASLYTRNQDLLSYSEIMRRSRTSKGLVDYQNVLVKKGGELIQTSTNYSPIYDEKGNITESLAYIRDISERLSQERKIKELAAVVEQASTAMLIKDNNEIITFVNDATTQILGYEPGELIGNTSDLYYPEEYKEFRDSINKRIRNGEKINGVTIPLNHKDGSPRECTINYSGLFNENGEYIGSTCVFNDYTETRALQQQTRDLTAIIDQTDAAVIVRDIDGVITYANSGATQMFGFSEQDLLGNTFEIFTRDEDIESRLEVINRVVKNGEFVHRYRTTGVRMDGSTFDISINYSPQFDEDYNIVGFNSIAFDVSKEVELEREKHESEVMMQNLFENFANGFYLLELTEDRKNLRYLMVNKTYAEWLGKSREEIEGQLMIDVLPKEMDYFGNYLRVIETGNVKSYEGYSLTLGKHVNYVIYSPEEGQVAVIATDRDNVVEAENKLARSENEMSMLFSSMTSGFVVLKAVRDENDKIIDFRFEIVNAMFEVVEGLEAGVTQGRLVSELFDWERLNFPAFVDVAENHGKATLLFERPELSKVLENVLYSPEHDYIACIINDITERIEAEKELREAYEETMMIVDQMPAPVVLVDEAGMIIRINNELLSIVEVYDEDNILGRSILEFVVPYEGISKVNIMDFMRSEKSFKSAIRNSAGKIIYLFVNPRKMLYRGETVYISLCQDIEMQIKTENALITAARDAQIANEMKTNFLANMSHEIRTPLNAILGFSELALDTNGISKEMKNYFEKIRTSTYGLVGIINDILDISKIESGKMELERIPFQLFEVLAHCESVANKQAADKQIKLLYDPISPQERLFVGDPVKLRQVLINLVSNAIKFTDVGTVRVTTKLTELDNSRISVMFEIKDSGIGMSAEHLERIFEPFVQADASTTRKYGGTGLGLPITKSIIELMGGELKVSSFIGLGSRFSFELVFDTVPLSEFNTNQNTLNKRPIFNSRVLVCEDNEMNQQVIVEHLRRIGINSVVAENGKIGVEQVKKSIDQNKPFDLIFMDVHMPVMDGIEATKVLQQMGINTPIVAMTANMFKSDIDSYLKLGMCDYVGKPFTVSQLWSCLLRHLDPIILEDIELQEEVYTGDDDVILNEKLGIERSAGDEKLYRKIKVEFYKSNKALMESLQQYLAIGDVKTAHRIIHTLKGTSAMIGAERLAKVALDVEQYFKKALNDIELGRIEFNELKAGLVKEVFALDNHLRAVLSELEIVVEEEKIFEEAMEDNEFNVDEAILLIDNLQPLLEAEDIQAKDYISQIRKTLAVRFDQAHDLIDHIENYDFDVAAEVLRKIKEELGDR